MSTVLARFCRVKNTSEIKLSLTIGFAQKGYSTVYLEDEKIGEWDGSFTKSLEIQGNDLKGKTLFCHTLIIDLRSETDETSVTYELTGGKADFKQTLKESVDKPGGVKHYVATFTFIP